jgi:hypothetical protein
MAKNCENRRALAGILEIEFFATSNLFRQLCERKSEEEASLLVFTGFNGSLVHHSG